MPDDIDLLQMFRDELPGPSAGAWARARAAVSAARSEEGPARHRRRLSLRYAAVATAALVAGAVALVAVGVPGSRHTGTEGSAVDTAYVVKRVNSALSAATPGAIAHMTVTTRRAAIYGGRTTTTTAEEWSHGDQWRSVTDSPTGHLAYDESSSTSATSSVYTLASYLTRTWARQAGLGRPAGPVSDPRGCGPAAAALPLLFQLRLPGTGPSASPLPATVAGALRTAISCGTLAVAGPQRVDGIEAIELTSRPDSRISETIWVSPGTYLPVRVMVHSAPGRPVVQETADITWLPPTAPNLAKLTVPIPAGFRQVPFAEVAAPIIQQTTGGPPKAKALCPAPDGPLCTEGTSASGSSPQHAGHSTPDAPVPYEQTPKSR
jgi:hypothetical protein